MPSSDDEQAVSSDDDRPVTKKQKRYDADGPIEDDKTARAKLEADGFDPDDVHTARSDLDPPERWRGVFRNVTPMAYFASLGDLPMCRYLYHVRGATTTSPAKENWTKSDSGLDISPMYAAVRGFQAKTAKWLFCHGAERDAFAYVDSNDDTSLSICFYRLRKQDHWSDSDHRGMVELAQWFILNGALDLMPGHLDLSQTLACCAAAVHAHVVGSWLPVDEEENTTATIGEANYALAKTKPMLLNLSKDLLMQTDAFSCIFTWDDSRTRIFD